MKTLFIFAGLLLGAANADARPNTLNYACADAKALVDSHGAIVLSTGAYTYDRFVAHGGYCLSGEIARPAWVPTYDKASCFIGYTCRMHDGR